MAEVEWDAAAEQEFLRSPDGPVMRELLPKLGAELAARAKANCPRRSGVTADSIRVSQLSVDTRGPYVRVGSGYVGIFLEHPAKQYHRPRHFLSDAARAMAGES